MVRKCRTHTKEQSSSISVVVMHDATGHVAALHGTFSDPLRDWHGATLLSALVRARPVVVLDVFTHNCSQVAFTYDQQTILHSLRALRIQRSANRFA